MKIQCGVCNIQEALVFCCADETALCFSCDRRIHCANKLAGQHRRLSLLVPNSNPSNAPPLCDICQEKRGFVFCQEDRAILCGDCDGAIHNANHLTAKHKRFLLTGIKLSASPIPSEKREMITDANADNSSSSSSSSSISEYLMETLPGWHVEDFLFEIDEALPFAESSYGLTEDLSRSSGTLKSSDFEGQKNQSGGKGNRKQRSKDFYIVPQFQDASNNN